MQLLKIAPTAPRGTSVLEGLNPKYTCSHANDCNNRGQICTYRQLMSTRKQEREKQTLTFLRIVIEIQLLGLSDMPVLNSELPDSL